MSTGYSWEGIRQVRAMLLGARQVSERLCGGYVYLGRYISVRPLPFFTFMYCIDIAGRSSAGAKNTVQCSKMAIFNLYTR